MSVPETIRVLCFGDVVGRPGRNALREALSAYRVESSDLVVVNAENGSGGLGLSPEDADELFALGVSVITLGDHTWQNRQLHGYLDHNRHRCLRPGNYPEGAPGSGACVVALPSGIKVGVMNLIGRVFFNFALDCPFRKADRYLEETLAGCDAVICDMHAEATSEKVAMGRYLDGRASLVFGTHTHVQTADEQILEGGAGFITDAGMCGAANSVIGMDPEAAIQRLLSGIPRSYKLGGGPGIACGIKAELETGSRKTRKIERIRHLQR